MPKTLKIQHNYQDIFQSVDAVCITKIYRNEVLKTYETDVSLAWDNDKLKAHKGMVATSSPIKVCLCTLTVNKINVL